MLKQKEFESKYVGKIYCGDCLSIMKDWPDKCVDLVLTDPPYGLDDKWTGGTWFTKNVYATDNLLWDKKVLDTYIREIILLGENAIIWGGNYYDLPPSRCWLSWSKINQMPTMADFELAWTTFDKPSKEFRSLRNGWERNHPTEKIIELGIWCIDLYSKPNDLILDCYCGSGTFCVAAKMLGRNYIGIDISPEYCKIAEERLKAVDTGVPVKERRCGQIPLFPVDK